MIEDAEILCVDVVARCCTVFTDYMHKLTRNIDSNSVLIEQC